MSIKLSVDLFTAINQNQLEKKLWKLNEIENQIKYTEAIRKKLENNQTHQLGELYINTSKRSKKQIAKQPET